MEMFLGVTIFHSYSESHDDVEVHDQMFSIEITTPINLCLLRLTENGIPLTN